MSGPAVLDVSVGQRELPEPVTSLIGRTEETRDVLELIARDDVRLVTLVGPGGVGKTRLATHIARQAEPYFPDGVAFVTPAPIIDPSLIATAISTALGLADHGADSCGEQVATYLAGRRMLLVLDNVEHLLSAAPLISDLITRSPGLTVLTTSRVVLRLSGERSIPILPLPIPKVTSGITAEQLGESDAVQLFLERARAVRPSLDLTSITALAIAQIVRMLDGLPLAIELAAARSNVLSPVAMAARLERRLPLLTSGPRDRPLRQQTMRDAIAWSFDLLLPEERILFRKLSIFIGGFCLEAGETLIGSTGSSIDVFDGVSSLVDKSLIQALERDDGTTRFAMLETIREFGLEQLGAAGEMEATASAHADWCLSLARRAGQRLFTPAERECLARLEEDRANLRAALAWLHEHDPQERFLELTGLLGRYWYKRERFTEGRTWLEKADVVARSIGPSRSHALVLENLGKLVGLQTRMSRGVTYFTEALAIWRELDDQRGIARGTVTLAEGYRLVPEVQPAIKHYEEGLRLLEELGSEPFWTSTALRGLGTVELMRGNIERAEQLFRDALDLARTTGGGWLVTTALYGIGDVASQRGRHAEALASFQESLSVAWELRDRLAVVTTLPAVGRALMAADELERAVRVLGATASVAEILAGEVEGLPTMLAEFDEILSAARVRLGESAYGAAWTSGRSPTIEAGVQLALAQVADALAGSPGSRSSGRSGNPLPGGLSEREAEVLRLTAAGLSNAQIAERLYLSPHTIRAHHQRIYTKLNIGNKAEAVRFALENGLA